MSRKIEVVAGVIVGDVPRQFLIARKSKGELKGKFEFPGGKIETGETHQEALKRELKEELGLDVEVGPHISTTHHVYHTMGVDVTLHAYFAHISTRKDEQRQEESLEGAEEKELDRVNELTEESTGDVAVQQQEDLIQGLTLVEHDQLRWISLDDIAIESVQLRRDSEVDPSTLLHSQIDPEFERKHCHTLTHPHHPNHHGNSSDNGSAVPEGVSSSATDQMGRVSTSEQRAPFAPTNESSSMSEQQQQPLHHHDFLPADIPVLRRLAELSFFVDVSPRLRL